MRQLHEGDIFFCLLWAFETRCRLSLTTKSGDKPGPPSLANAVSFDTVYLYRQESKQTLPENALAGGCQSERLKSEFN